MRIAVAEDDDDTRELITDELRTRGFEVLGAVDGASLLSLLRRGRFDLVITDLRIPSLSGGDVLRTRRGEGDETPFLVITAAPPEATESIAAVARVTILHKPIVVDVLVSTIERLLAVQPPAD